ncbi:hypothetical protein LTR66_013298 [Elasticomyces elasticus]|nr:hypothetical protein LTR66_013298 [Elasticomyces elasticus]
MSDYRDTIDEIGKTGSGRRSLRSADTGSRCKSELAQYFPNYEQIISLEDPKSDPLNEATYFRAHRQFERQEQQLRNIERNRAQHEQQVLERLLDELRGHDWLRVMGLPSVHETEKETYEPKREKLVQELVTFVGKLQAWKDEE